MNWKKIQEECPKAWEEFCKTLHYESIEASNDCLILNGRPHQPYDFHERDLYDFFDGVGIHAMVTWLDTSDRYEGCVETNSGLNLQLPAKHNTRQESETEAFTAAFYELEKQLA